MLSLNLPILTDSEMLGKKIWHLVYCSEIPNHNYIIQRKLTPSKWGHSTMCVKCK